jgi:polyisoprenoid-binding protein YceI
MRRLAGILALLLGLVLSGCNKTEDKPTGAPRNMREMYQNYENQRGKPGPTKEQPISVADDKVAISGENSRIDFVGTKPEGKHDGGFATFTGTIRLDAAGTQVTGIDVTIDMDSVWTDTPMLTQHLKSPDFFDVKEHPKATFTATKIEPAKEGEYKITGDLTLHGTKKEITFPAAISVKDKTLSLKGTVTINRKEFGVSYSTKPVDDNVAITVRVGVAPK